MPDAPMIWVHCRACEDDFQARRGSVADQEKLCNPCAERRDNAADEER